MYLRHCKQLKYYLFRVLVLFFLVLSSSDSFILLRFFLPFFLFLAWWPPLLFLVRNFYEFILLNDLTTANPSIECIQVLSVEQLNAKTQHVSAPPFYFTFGVYFR
jgi:hypothetical protein